MLQTTCNFIISNTYFTNVFISIHNTYIVLSKTIFPIVSEFTDPLYILRLTYNHIESIQYCLLQYCYISQTFLFPHLLSSVLNKVHNENLWYLPKSQFLHNITEQIHKKFQVEKIISVHNLPTPVFMDTIKQETSHMSVQCDLSFDSCYKLKERRVRFWCLMVSQVFRLKPPHFQAPSFTFSLSTLASRSRLVL